MTYYVIRHLRKLIDSGDTQGLIAYLTAPQSHDITIRWIDFSVKVLRVTAYIIAFLLGLIWSVLYAVYAVLFVIATIRKANHS